MNEEKLPSRTYDEEARKMGDYLDILSLTRVVVYGAQSKYDYTIINGMSFLEKSKGYNLLIILPFCLREKGNCDKLTK